ncbi:MAG TPA: WG repeat-containing protein, partial [Flavipsychrobacter sp.]|nr:WG repeat-containing protein [Flavipsychrobacter sp.]
MNRSTPKALLSLAGLALFLSLSAQTSKKAAPAKKPTAVISAPVTKSAVPFLKKNGKYILVDSLSLQPLGDIEYKEFYDMSEGLRTTVNLSGKYGYIDKEGKEIIPFQFDYAGEFKGGVAKVRKNGKLGFIDLSGNEVVPAKYDDIYDFNEGLARAKKGKL